MEVSREVPRWAWAAGSRGAPILGEVPYSRERSSRVIHLRLPAERERRVVPSAEGLTAPRALSCGVKGSRQQGSRWAVVLLLAGSVLLLSTFFLGWYSINLASGTSSYVDTFYPWAFHLSGSQAGASYSNTTSYSSVFLGNTGILYLFVAGFIAAGTGLGVWAACRAGRGSSPKHPHFAPALVAMIVAFALAGPVLVAVVQPSTICAEGPPEYPPLLGASPTAFTSDSPNCLWVVVSPYQGGIAYDSGSGPGPQSSFYGSTIVGGQPFSWGPSIGWYVAVLAAAFLIAGAVLGFGRLAGPYAAAKAPPVVPGRINSDPDSPPAAGPISDSG